MLETDAYNNIGHILSPDVFYKESHQIIFRAIETLAAEYKPIDILTVVEQLKSKSNLETVGGAYHISELTNRVASTANLEYHSMILYQKFIQRELIRYSSFIIQLSYEDTGYDEAVNAYHEATTHIDNLLAGRRSDRTMAQIMEDHAKELERRMEMADRGDIIGIRTGISDLNKITHGWKPGELIIIAGRPGMGKTAVALNLFTKNAAINEKHILFFSLEMDEIPLADRLVCSYGGIDPDMLKSGKIKNDQAQLDKYFSASNELRQLPISIDDNAHSDINHIATVSRSKRRKGLCDMIVIDYLQLIEVQQTGNYKNREREVAEMSRSLKLLAKELKIPVLLLAQLNRGVEGRADKRPSLADLRESGAIEQDADMVIFPYRPEYYGIMEDDQGESLEGVMMLIVAKNRNGKRTGDIFAKYSPDLTQFFDYGETPDEVLYKPSHNDPF